MFAVAPAVNPWAFHLHAEVWVVMVAIIVGYWYLVRQGPVTRKQVAEFTAGWLCLCVGASSPIHDIAERYLFSVHMFQHLLFSLVAPGLLFLGIPEWLQKKLWGSGRQAATLRRLGRPLVAGGIYTVWLLFSHWPKLVDYALHHEPVHFWMHLMLFSTAALMWFPALNRNPDLPILTPPGRMLYVFMQSIIPTVPASFFTFSDHAFYKTYAQAPRVFDISAVNDQQLAAALMKVGGGLILWGIIAAMFFRWTADDERKRKANRRVLTWDEVQAELARSEAPKVG